MFLSWCKTEQDSKSWGERLTVNSILDMMQLLPSAGGKFTNTVKFYKSAVHLETGAKLQQFFWWLTETCDWMLGKETLQVPKGSTISIVNLMTMELKVAQLEFGMKKTLASNTALSHRNRIRTTYAILNFLVAIFTRMKRSRCMIILVYITQSIHNVNISTL